MVHGAGEEAKVHTKAKAQHPDHSIAFDCIRLLKLLDFKTANLKGWFSENLKGPVT